MPTITTADAILVVSASRFGYPGVLAEMIGAAKEPRQATELACSIGEVGAAVEGVTIALAGGLPDRPRRARAARGDAERIGADGVDTGRVGTGRVDGSQLDRLAELVVRCAAQADVAGVERICSDALTSGTFAALLCSMVRDINAGLDALDDLPGPGGSGLLERLGLAAAARL